VIRVTVRPEISVLRAVESLHFVFYNYQLHYLSIIRAKKCMKQTDPNGTSFVSVQLNTALLQRTDRDMLPAGEVPVELAVADNSEEGDEEVQTGAKKLPWYKFQNNAKAQGYAIVSSISLCVCLLFILF
jgi:hypothetical protein